MTSLMRVIASLLGLMAGFGTSASNAWADHTPDMFADDPVGVKTEWPRGTTITVSGTPSVNYTTNANDGGGNVKDRVLSQIQRNPQCVHDTCPSATNPRAKWYSDESAPHFATTLGDITKANIVVYAGEPGSVTCDRLNSVEPTHNQVFIEFANGFGFNADGTPANDGSTVQAGNRDDEGTSWLCDTTPVGQYGPATESLIVMNWQRWRWWISAEPPVAHTLDLESVLAHEMGHTLGFGHYWSKSCPGKTPGSWECAGAEQDDHSDDAVACNAGVEDAPPNVFKLDDAANNPTQETMCTGTYAATLRQRTPGCHEKQTLKTHIWKQAPPDLPPGYPGAPPGPGCSKLKLVRSVGPTTDCSYEQTNPDACTPPTAPDLIDPGYIGPDEGTISALGGAHAGYSIGVSYSGGYGNSQYFITMAPAKTCVGGQVLGSAYSTNGAFAEVQVQLPQVPGFYELCVVRKFHDRGQHKPFHVDTPPSGA